MTPSEKQFFSSLLGQFSGLSIRTGLLLRVDVVATHDGSSFGLEFEAIGNPHQGNRPDQEKR